MARWSEKDFQDFLKQRGGQLGAKPKTRRSLEVARMSDEQFDAIIIADPKQGRGLRFELEIPPLPKRSARVAGIRNGKIRTYIPKPTRNYMNYCKTMAGLAMSCAGQPMYKLTVKVEILFCFRGNEDELPTHPSDGDLDNLEKAVYDSMSKVVYSDDRLVSGDENYKLCMSDEAKIVVLITPLRPSVLKNMQKSLPDGKKVFVFDAVQYTDAKRKPPFFIEADF
jgi:Holliday junction resolvase RusA-like endonuclease